MGVNWALYGLVASSLGDIEAQTHASQRVFTTQVPHVFDPVDRRVPQLAGAFPTAAVASRPEGQYLSSVADN